MVILGFDVGAALTPDVSLFETVVRRVLMYLVIFVLLGVILRGRTSAISVSDLLVLVLIADAAQNAMAAEHTSITSGVVLVTTIMLSSFAMDLAGVPQPDDPTLRPPGPAAAHQGRARAPEGALDRDDDRGGADDAAVRLNGVEEVTAVKAAYLEGNGSISVIKRSGEEGSQGAPKTEAIPG